MRKTLVFAAVLGLTLAACAEPSEPASSDPTQTDWSLQSGSVDGVDIPIVEDHPITLVFTGDPNGIGGTSACNTYFGTYAIDSPSISFSGIGSTQMACDPAEVMESESMYFDAMSKVDAFTATDSSLTLTGDGVELVFAASPSS